MDIKRCVAGKNNFGQWHIACDTVGAPALQILQNMGYTNSLSSIGITYFQAARWICARGGAAWTTNALNLPTTCATLPTIDPF